MTEQKPNIMDRAICLNLQFHGIGNRKKVASEQITTDAESDWLHVSKTLLAADSYKAIGSLDGDLKSYLKRRCLPSMFRAGVYLLPIDLVEEVDARIEKHKGERQALVEKFCLEYPSLVDAATKPLGSLFDESDYPPVERVRAAFYFTAQYVTFSTPGKLQNISKALFQREQAKAERQWAEAAEEVRQVLRASMAELVTKMAERLKDVNGKKQVFRDSLIGNMTDFLDVFNARNIGDDADLAALVDKAKGLLNGTDAVILRSDEDLRAKVQCGFEEIQNNLASMIKDRPTRLISFED